jgi:tetratricopeptide (TPR) repeat protein
MPLHRRIFVSVCSLITAILLSSCASVNTTQKTNYGLRYYKIGLYPQALPSLEAAARGLENESPTNPRYVDVLIALADISLNAKSKEAAENYYKKAVKVAEQLSASETTRLRNSLNNLGYFYQYSRPAEALPLFHRAADISKSSTDRVIHAIDLDNLGLAYHGVKNFERGLAFSEQALELISIVKTGEYIARTKGVILYNIAYSYKEIKQNAKAEEYFKQSLSTLRSAPTTEVEPWRISQVVKIYAELLKNEGRSSEANELERQ